MTNPCREQRGLILPWAMMAVLLGALIAVPVVSLAGSAIRGQGRIEDETRAYYAADAQIHAVIEDLKRGADASPQPPYTYTAPLIDFGDIVPSVSVDVVESQTLATLKPINYTASSTTVIAGSNPQGTVLDLATDDNVYFKLTDAGTPPNATYEVTSTVIDFPTVSFGEVRIVAASTKSSTKVEVFICNPDDPLHTVDGCYNPVADVTVILEAASTEQTFSVGLEDADVDYLNSLPDAQRQLKIRVKATRTGGFRLDTDQIVFAIAGVVTTDQRNVVGAPAILNGTYSSGTEEDLQFDDTSYHIATSVVVGADNVIEYEVTSDAFAFAALDTLSIPFVVRASKDNVTLQVFFHRGSYGASADFQTVIPLKNTDKSVEFAVSPSDVAYLNSINPITAKIKVKTILNSSFQLESDRLVFVATSNSAPGEVVQQITQQYIDPGFTNPQFSQVLTKQGYLLRVYNARAGLMQVNWASHTPTFGIGKTSILVFRGLVIDGAVVVPPGVITTKPPAQNNDLLVASTSKSQESFLQTPFIDLDAGVHTIVFFNDSSSTMITDAYRATGKKEDTWIYMPAFKDYVIDVRVGNVGIKTVVRQAPGPTEPPAFPWSTTNINWIQNSVSVQSWEPYGVPRGERDDDEDGIENEIDGQYSGSFTDQSKTPSASFTDQNLGGTTFGSITDRGGLTVRIGDDKDPAEGVLVEATGTSGTSTISACSSPVYVSAGDAVTITCSSIALEVHRGPVEMRLDGRTSVDVPTGSYAKAIASQGGFQIESSPRNVAPVTLTLEDCRQGVVQVLRGARMHLTRSSNQSCVVENISSGPDSLVVEFDGQTKTLESGESTQVASGAADSSPVATPTATAIATAVPTATPSPTTTPVPSQIEVALLSVADAEIAQDNPSTASGSGSSMTVRSTNRGNPDRNARSLVRFDLTGIPEGASVVSATLRLHLLEAPDSSRTYEVRRLDSSWSELGDGAVTWASQPGAPAVAALTDTGTTAGVWLEWDVTTDVRRFTNGISANQGWLVRDSEESAPGDHTGKFATREAAGSSHDPQLLITYRR